MATKSMAYDAPAYQAVMPLGFSLTGNAGATAKFAAFTDTLVKSFTVKATTAGTSADVVTAYKYSGTATTTHVLTTIGSGVVTGTNVVSTFTLAQGELLASSRAPTLPPSTAWALSLPWCRVPPSPRKEN